MSHDLLSRFLPLLSARTGLHVREKDRPSLERALETRIRESSLSHSDYIRTLELDASLTGEWKVLLPRLTNGESYFLRDKGQITLLRDHLLPELIERRKKQKSLRLWSAGCSTGEEAYSLAMLISELLPRRNDWNVSVLGTDINEESLARARRGVYGSWAFRAVPDDVRTRYFEENESGLEIRADLRALTRFVPLNLRGNGFPSQNNELVDIDLIVCRNVLIYFDSPAVAHALKGFSATLRPGGYLLTGHAELAGHDPAPLAVRAFLHSVAYQKLDAAPVGLPASAVTIAHRADPRPAPVVARNPVPPMIARPSSTINGVRNGNATPATNPAASPTAPKSTVLSPASQPRETPAGAADLCAKARAAADAGNYDAAVSFCRAAVAADATSAEAYALWAQVAMEQGNCDESKALWKKVIYLAPAEPEAYLELSALYHRDGDMRRARQMLETALSILNAVPAAAGGQTAHYEAMTRHIQELLRPDATAGVARESRIAPQMGRRK